VVSIRYLVKLKDMINYIQILISVFMLVGFQFMGRIFNLTYLTVTFQPAWWHFLIPTTWFAAPFSLFIENNSSQYLHCFMPARPHRPDRSCGLIHDPGYSLFRKQTAKIEQQQYAR